MTDFDKTNRVVVSGFLSICSLILTGVVIWFGQSVYASQLQLAKIEVILAQHSALLQDIKKDRAEINMLKQRVTVLESKYLSPAHL